MTVLQLDPIDILILQQLMEDGRVSLRQVAEKTSLSTPTVSSRFERMMRAGLIKKFAPIFNPEAMAPNQGIFALVTLRVPSSRVATTAKKLVQMKEVCDLYATTGENNITLKVNFTDTQALREFLEGRALRALGAEVVTSQVITGTLKDEHPIPFAEGFKMKLRCDFCKGNITSNRPYSIKVASTRYYFCCKLCRRSYLDKHGERIKSINASLGKT